MSNKRVAVLSLEGQPLMPTKASRARKWLIEGKAKVVHNDLGIFQIQLINHTRRTAFPPVTKLGTDMVRVSTQKI